MPPSTIARPRETEIRDQRVMVGTAVHRTPEDVQAAWQRWANEKGLAHRLRMGDDSRALHTSRQPIVAYVNDNCWTGDCPNCNGGVPTWPGGHDYGCCLDCGTIYPIVYPEPGELAAAVEALEARPPMNRHYDPRSGETADKLRLENIEHGFHPTRPFDESYDDIVADVLRRHGDDGLKFLRSLGVSP